MSPRFRTLLGLALSLGLAAAAWAQLRRGEQASGFRVPDYDAEGNLKMVIQGDQARMLTAQDVELENFRIDIYKDGEVDARVTAPHGIYNQRTRRARSTNDIRIVRGTTVISGTGYAYDAGPQRFEIHANAKVVVQGLKPRMIRPDQESKP
jgi:hypothetical protein